MSNRKEVQIQQSWCDNADAWSNAVRGNHIHSRVQLTNQAIIDAVLATQPASVLDLGCGEGWLSRALAETGCSVTGTDATLRLIELAQQKGGADYIHCDYQQLIARLQNQRFDCIVFNFSLFGEQSVERLLSELHSYLNPGGRLIIQTLHPITACGGHPYQDGWRDGSWDGCGENFSNPFPWFFRTQASWINTLIQQGWMLQNIQEPILTGQNHPASLILVCSGR